MNSSMLEQKSEYEWIVSPHGKMRVPGIIYASEILIRDMDEKVLEQISNVAALPGIEKAACAMPDAHRGYGFPIGGVAAFDPERGGVVSAGGVGFDISCGVRTILTGIPANDISPLAEKIADTLFYAIPAGLGSTGNLRLNKKEMDDMLMHGAQWAINKGYGNSSDIDRIESHGKTFGAMTSEISEKARKRQQDETGTLGSGNHYLEVQRITDIYDSSAAQVFGLHQDETVISLHCGSRGLGHQVATEFSKKMLISASSYGIDLPDRELACAPIHSPEGKAYLGAMRAAMNCAAANRQVLTHLVRQAIMKIFTMLQPADLPLLYDVSHNTCSQEEHIVKGEKKLLFVHRKGATRAFGPGYPDLPADLKSVGQPVIIGGSMGTSSYILTGTAEEKTLPFKSACHGAGRRLSRSQAAKQWESKEVVRNLAQKKILIRSHSNRGVAEEAPGAYKDVSAVVESAEMAGLARKIVRLSPMICIKG